jgi:transcriptional regulator with PAS, ATPase and Fis domain
MSERREHTCTLTTLRSDAVEVPNLRVVVLGDPAAQRAETSLPLGIDPVVLGTSDECELVVDDRRVSRKHCSLAVTEAGLVLSDLGSKNGTFVGDVSVREAVIPPGTVVTMGGVRFVVRVVGEPSVLALSPIPRFGAAVGGSVPMRALFAKLSQAAATDEKILLRGESGTGKELLARAIHDASARRDGPFVVLDCSAIAPHLVEAEVFGSIRGAFTGSVADRAGVLEQANGGTLFLDEIGELPSELQPKLLRALESGEYRPVGASALRSFDARVVAATHRDLRAAIAGGGFRSDLYYRIAVIDARVPPLRERGEDLDLLTERILAEQRPSRSIRDLPPNTMAMLRAHPFPGNVRELRNVLARLALFPELGAEALETMHPESPAGPTPADGFSAWFAMPLRDAREQIVERFEASYLAAKMREHGGNVARAAQAIGVSRQFLYRLLERYGLRTNDP